MKIKNLLLAGLAIVAMSACSNENDAIVDNGQVNGAKATMQLHMSFANLTRGNSTATEDGTDKGTGFEYNSATISALLVYGESNQVVVVPGIKTSASEDNQTVVTEPFTVTAGQNVKVYAFVNPIDPKLAGIVAANLATKNIGAAITEEIDYLAESVAKNNEFMMCPAGDPEAITIKAGSVENVANVKVERVVAKLDETTGQRKFELQNQTIEGDILTVELLNHTFCNLNKDAFLLGNGTSSFNTTGFFQAYKAPAVVGDYKWKACSTGQVLSTVTYSYENINNTVYNTASSGHTSVIYEGQVYFGQEAASTFYTAKKYVDGEFKTYLYKNWADLTKDFAIDSELEGNRDKLAELGIKTYVDGKAYYFAPISHTGKGATIIRNNWYKLKVSKISDLGDEYPHIQVDEATKLTLNVSIEPWTIQLNNIEL